MSGPRRGSDSYSSGYIDGASFTKSFVMMWPAGCGSGLSRKTDDFANHCCPHCQLSTVIREKSQSVLMGIMLCAWSHKQRPCMSSPVRHPGRHRGLVASPVMR
jgi:hypothetical protein